MNEPDGSTVHVLLVEDDEMHAELAQRAFEGEPNIELRVVRYVREAQAAVSATPPDMVVADLNLPDGRGTDLIGARRFPVVIMTSQGSESSAVEAMRAGALDYVVKSDTMFFDLPHIVTRALREWKQSHALARANRFLRAQYEVASALAAARDVRVAASEILKIVCQRAGWVMGEFWRLDGPHEVVRREAYWAADAERSELQGQGPDPSVPIGQALPGTTLAHGVPIRVADLRADQELRGSHLSTDLELRGAFGFPVEVEGQALGVLTFYTTDAETPDHELHSLLEAVSNQVAVLVQRRAAQEERDRLQAELVDRARLAAIGQTSATLGHEIANPLNGMFLASQLLQRRLARDPNADPKLVAGVERILKENRRLQGLLVEFRSLSKRQVLRRAPTDIAKLIDDIVELQAPVFEAAGLELQIDVDAALPLLELDHAKLTQVLLNLTKNTVEALDSKPGQVLLRARSRVDTVIIDVVDNGPGIPADFDVFAPFKTTKEVGTGLGLAVARQVAEAHGGTLEHVVTEAPGATFRLVLPVSAPAVSSAG